MQAAWLYEWKCLSVVCQSTNLVRTNVSPTFTVPCGWNSGDTQVKTKIFQILKKLWINYD